MNHISDETIVASLSNDTWPVVELFCHQYGELPNGRRHFHAEVKWAFPGAWIACKLGVGR